MRTAAMVRVQGDAVMLELWLKYYSRYFDDLIVFGASTPEGAFDHLKYKFEFIRVGAHIHSMTAHEMVFAKQIELLKDHDWVLYTDLDEFVVADPEKFKGLRDFMRRSPKGQKFCEGYEVVQVEGEGMIDFSKPILKQRSKWVRDGGGSYNKPALSSVPTAWVEGFHMLKEQPSDEIIAMKDTGLFMIHLKWMDMERALEFPRTGQAIDVARGVDIPEEIRRIF